MKLRDAQAAGHIEALELHPAWHFPISGTDLFTVSKTGRRLRIRYTADFRYRLKKTGELVVEDVKGVLTRDAVLRIALMRACHGIEVRLVR